MKKRTIILAVAGALFISGNMYLTLHKDSKVDRTSFITSWSEATTETLTETLKTAGVVIPAEEHPVYFNSEQGGFQQFLVKKGDPVTVGTELYEYLSIQAPLDRERLQTEISQLNREVALIEDQIDQLEYLQTVSASTATDSIPVSGDGVLTGVQSGTLVEVTLAKEIYDKERDIRQLEGKIEVYEDSLATLSDTSELDVRSEVTGTVKDINYDLKNPIMTIISDSPKVRGTFLETDLAKVEEGMEAYITSELLNDKLAGKLTTIANHSEDEPDVEKESEFAFEIQLDGNSTAGEESETSQSKLALGSHVNITIVTNKAENAVTLSEEQIKKGSYVYVIPRTGKIERRPIKMGLEVNGKVEIIEGLVQGETIITNPNQVERPSHPFITRLDFLRINPSLIKQEPAMTWLKAIWVGFSKQ